MSTGILRSEPAPGVVALSIDRPACMNALDCATADALCAALRLADQDAAVHVVVLRGSGKAFSTGLDLSELDPDGDIDLGAVLEFHFEPLLRTQRSMSIPVIAAVNGPAAGVSAGIALSADICIASESAYFLLPFADLGLVPDGALTWLLPQLAGNPRATALTLLGERIPAKDAADWGLIWRCMPAGAFDAYVQQCATRLASLPRAALTATKTALQAAETNTYDEQLRLERQLQQQLGRSGIFRNHLSAFLRK